MVAGWHQAADTADRMAALAARNREIWLEVLDPRHLDAAATALPYVHGFVGRGAEAGGTTGTVSSFVLAQFLARQDRPFLIQGGIGLRSAVACRVAGATGVVLDDQWLLTAESPFEVATAEPARRIAAKILCNDTVVAGRDLGNPRRIVGRADVPAARALVTDALALSADRSRPIETRAAEWVKRADDALGWGDPGQWAWPAGESAGFARAYGERFRTCGRLVQAIAAECDGASLSQARQRRPLAPGSPLARAHRTTYPVVQGPMTRVSDSAAFAEAVARGGALPLLALALLDRAACTALLTETAARLGDRSWGVGILGFVPADVRAAQLDAIRACRPPFALIAGGRPDQVAELDALGIATYLHAPDPELLRRALAQGTRRFVFEGGECGGHTGPVSSFTLWEQAIDVLLAEVAPGERGQVHVLFAGGIHDARSAAMVSAMAAPLDAAGMHVGVLMGTAYLFTDEIVGSGAIVPGFQREALACRGTVSLATGTGHAIRCADTPFASEFERSRLDLAAEGAAGRTDALEQLTLGRARVASKGMERTPEGPLRALAADQQHARGMFMMGEVATLRTETLSMATLHQEVCEGSGVWLDGLGSAAARSGIASDRTGPASRIAIVGMACLVPGADSAEGLWQALLARRPAIREIPAGRFDWRLYFDPDPAAADRMYSRWGGFLDEIPFDPRRFGIPPRSLTSISISQLLTLEVSDRALHDAGYGSGGFDRENAAVIVGMSTTADLFHYYVTRSTMPLAAAGTSREALDRLPTWTEESFPGLLLNVTAGRVANRLDLGGPNFAIDAACASSLAAVQAGVRELESGRSSLAIVAGVELDQTPHVPVVQQDAGVVPDGYGAAIRSQGRRHRHQRGRGGAGAEAPGGRRTRRRPRLRGAPLGGGIE
ncbi:MAG: beta-ketoacyl synthase N-terminal-like domain-containing protein [Vicinamibacterales bacterium]